MDKPSKILVKIRISSGRAEEFRRAGITLVARTQEQDQALRARQAEEARAVGRDPFRGMRYDVTGTLRPDSGTPIFSWDPQGRQEVCLCHTLDDIRDRLGMKLTQVSLLQKPRDQMLFLVLQFTEQGEEVRLSETQNSLVERVLNRVYGNLHGFRNPDRSMTLNAAHAVEDAQEIKDVRIYPDGAVRVERRQ